MSDLQRVFVSGIFNILHPGHVRLLRFAKSLGDSLIVAVLSDTLAGDTATNSQQQRLEAVASLRMVDEAFLVHGSVTDVIATLQPEIVVKGREHLDTLNVEREVLERYGGELVFSSGDSFFSVTDLISEEVAESSRAALALASQFMSQHGIQQDRLLHLVESMQRLRVMVVGDVILDEYVSCHPLGMSREDPTLVVTPVETGRFLGGAAIVAGHAAALGDSASLHSVVGADSGADFLRTSLDTLGVRYNLHEDGSRPTTTKRRFRAGNKTLLRVNELRQDAISNELQRSLIEEVIRDIGSNDLLIFSDFNYGVLPQPVVSRVTEASRSAGLFLAADSQSSSQIGDVARFTGMHLLTPTEYEARLATRKFDDGLVVLADHLRTMARARAVFLTLAEDGVLLRGSLGGSPVATDRLPALNRIPVDVAGAGDSLLVASSMAMAVGGTAQEAALIGSVAAALQVAVKGNKPVSFGLLVDAISR